MPVADIEREVAARDVVIPGSVRQVMNTALDNSQDLFERVSPGVWRWKDPESAPGGLSGPALAEEAYRLVIRSDPARKGLHYQEIKRLLLEDGVVILGGNKGKTVFSALSHADQWFEWVASGVFRWK